MAADHGIPLGSAAVERVVATAKFSGEQVLAAASLPLLIAHLQKRLRTGDVCSIPAEELQALQACESSADVLAVQQCAVAAKNDIGVVVDAGGSGAVHGAAMHEDSSKAIFFSVLDASPSRHKILRSTAAHGRVAQAAIVISLHAAIPNKELYKASGSLLLKQEPVMHIPRLLRGAHKMFT